MTPDEALDKLVGASTRKHVITWDKMGPSHGDPGGYPFIQSACEAVRHTTYEVVSYEEEKCNCPAKRHNEIVRELEDILRKAITS